MRGVENPYTEIDMLIKSSKLVLYWNCCYEFPNIVLVSII